MVGKVTGKISVFWLGAMLAGLIGACGRSGQITTPMESVGEMIAASPETVQTGDASKASLSETVSVETEVPGTGDAKTSFAETVRVEYVSGTSVPVQLPEELEKTITRYLEIINKGDLEHFSEVAGEQAEQPLRSIRIQEGRVAYRIHKVIWLDEDIGVIVMCREYPQPEPGMTDECVITAVHRENGWFITKACSVNQYGGGEAQAREILFNQLNEVYALRKTASPLTEEDMRKAAEAAFAFASERVFLNAGVSDEGRKELYDSLMYEYDTRWADPVLVNEWIASTEWVQFNGDPVCRSYQKEMILWITPTGDYLKRHPEFGLDFMRDGKHLSGWYFHCREADETTPPELAIRGWTAGPAVWGTEVWRMNEDYPHNRP